jgi:hypothetical protein
MAIDAVIAGVRKASGEVKLYLEPRRGSCPGQETLVVLNPPKEFRDLACLVSVEIWGGSDKLRVGDELIARRDGACAISLVAGWRKVVSEYREKRNKNRG